MDAGIADSSINAIYQYSGRRMFRHNNEQFNNTAAVEITRQCKCHIVNGPKIVSYYAVVHTERTGQKLQATLRGGKTPDYLQALASLQ